MKKVKLVFFLISQQYTAYFIFMRYILTGRDARTTRVWWNFSVPHLSARCCISSIRATFQDRKQGTENKKIVSILKTA